MIAIKNSFDFNTLPEKLYYKYIYNKCILIDENSNEYYVTIEGPIEEPIKEPIEEIKVRIKQVDVDIYSIFNDKIEENTQILTVKDLKTSDYLYKEIKGKEYLDITVKLEEGKYIFCYE